MSSAQSYQTDLKPPTSCRSCPLACESGLHCCRLVSELADGLRLFGPLPLPYLRAGKTQVTKHDLQYTCLAAEFATSSSPPLSPKHCRHSPSHSSPSPNYSCCSSSRRCCYSNRHSSCRCHSSRHCHSSCCCRSASSHSANCSAAQARIEPATVGNFTGMF